MKVGGNAFNNGVHFVSERFSAEVTMGGKPGAEWSIRLKKNGAGKSKTASRFMNGVRRIPFLRGVVSVITSQKLFLFLIAVMVLTDLSFFLADRMEPETGLMIENGMLLLGTIASLLMFLYLVRKVLLRAGRTRQFHGAEHKAINAYESGEGLSLESAKRASRVARRCGTELVVFVVLLYLFFSLFLTYSGICFLLALSVGYEIFNLKKGDQIPLLSLLFRFGYFCQRHLFTSEPTIEQLKAVVDAVNALERAETAEGGSSSAGDTAGSSL